MLVGPSAVLIFFVFVVVYGNLALFLWLSLPREGALPALCVCVCLYVMTSLLLQSLPFYVVSLGKQKELFKAKQQPKMWANTY